jgi:hypothetical protein
VVVPEVLLATALTTVQHDRAPAAANAPLPPRHAEVRADTAKWLEVMAGVGVRFVSHVWEAPSLLVKVACQACSRAGHLLLFDPPGVRDETRRSLLLMAQDGTASFRLAARHAEGSAALEETVRVALEHADGASRCELLPKTAVDMGHSVADCQNTL